MLTNRTCLVVSPKVNWEWQQVRDPPDHLSYTQKKKKFQGSSGNLSKGMFILQSKTECLKKRAPPHPSIYTLQGEVFFKNKIAKS